MATLWDDFTDFFVGTSPKFSVHPKSTLSPEQQKLLGPLSDVFGGRLTGIQEGTLQAPEFGGDLATQLDPSQVASLEGLTALASQISGAESPFAQAQEGLTGAQTALQEATQTPTAAGTFQGGDFSPFTGEFAGGEGDAGEFLRKIFDQPATDFDEFFRTNVQDPLLSQFQEDILPGISRSQGPSGFFSGDRRALDQRAQDELLQQLTRSRSDLAFRTEESRRGRQAVAAQGIDTLTGEAAGREFTGGQGALDRLLTGIREQETTGRALAISDADRASQAALTSALGQAEVAGRRADIAGAEGTTLGGIVSSGEIARRADAENTLLEYQDFLRTSGFEDDQIRLLMDFLGLRTTENIVKNQPGTSGFLSDIAVALAGGGSGGGGGGFTATGGSSAGGVT